MESYFFKLNYSDAISLARFRCGSHHLPNVTARFTERKETSNICQLCERGVIGDEYHYIFECDFFHETRAKYFDEKTTSRPSAGKMYSLFNTNDKKLLSNLSAYCRVVMKYFSEKYGSKSRKKRTRKRKNQGKDSIK